MIIKILILEYLKGEKVVRASVNILKFFYSFAYLKRQVSLSYSYDEHRNISFNKTSSRDPSLLSEETLEHGQGLAPLGKLYRTLCVSSYGHDLSSYGHETRRKEERERKKKGDCQWLPDWPLETPFVNDTQETYKSQ